MIDRRFEKKQMVAEVQDMIVDLTGDRSLRLDRPEGITALNITKIHNILRQVVASHTAMRENRKEWATILLAHEDLNGPLLKG